jgi:hypothetical protein
MTDKFDLNKINSFLEAATKTINCDSNCQKQQKTEELKQKYMEAKNNIILAEPEYQVAKQNYYTYISGKGEYDDIMKNELSEKADNVILLFKDFLNKEINKINIQLDSYNGLLINVDNVKELLKKYKKENDILYKRIKQEKNDIFTNERKTFYENQEIDSLKNFYSYFFFIVYIIAVICYSLFSLIYPSTLNFKMKIFLFVLFLILPFISTWILSKLVQFAYFIYSILPKNVYKNI